MRVAYEAVTIRKAQTSDVTDARGEADDAQRGAITMFNEQKRYESHIQRLQSDVHRANSAIEKMRTEAVGLRCKIQDVRDERANLHRQFDSAEAEWWSIKSWMFWSSRWPPHKTRGPDSNYIPMR
jgi:predicted  nucleic acid-binding Zn-ribbon protein